MKEFFKEKIKNHSLFENYDRIGESNLHQTYYFLTAKAFNAAMEKATADNRNVEIYSYSVGAKELDDMKTYFYITIYL